MEFRLLKDIMPQLDYPYAINNCGNIIVGEYTDRKGNIRKPKCLINQLDTYGYFQVGLLINGKQTRFLVHRLVGLAWIPNPENKPMINHKDGNKQNNHVSNLEWVTRSENAKHSFTIGLQCNKGERHPMHKLTESDVLAIRQIYSTGNISTRKLAQVYNVSKTNIKDIINKKIWQHI